MSKKDCFSLCYTTTSIKRRFFLLLLMCVFSFQAALADYYINFKDGRLYVFPSSTYKRLSRSATEITFTAKDDVVYTYLISDISSIDVKLTKELPVFTSYKFNNKYNYQVYTDAVGTITDGEVNIVVAGIGKRLTASFTLSDEKARAYVDGNQQESKVSRLRFENSRTYVVGYPGDMVLTQVADGQYALMPYGRTYSVNVDFLTDHSTSVPRIDINTVGGVPIASKEEYVDAEIIINGAGVFPSMTDSVQVKGRGNDTWHDDPDTKNPYRLKFASKVKPFGLTKGKNWVLLANNRKGSMLTNAIGMKTVSLIGTVAANHIIPVDLYVNGAYKGSYNFTEKVGLSNNSIDLDDETTAALLELDKNFDEAETQKFRSIPYDIPVNIKHPEFGEDSTFLSMDIISERFNSFVTDVNSGADFSRHLDMDQLARYLMASELICNREIFHPKSTYCYNVNLLDGNSKFVFGPMWDLDWCFGYDGATSSSFFSRFITGDFYAFFQFDQQGFVNALRNGPTVTRRIYELYKGFMDDGLDELCEFCNDYYQYAKPSLDMNNRFQLDDTNYDTQAVMAPDWIRQRAEYIFRLLKADTQLSGDLSDDGSVTVVDLTLLLDCLLLDDISSVRSDNADVNGDGEVNIEDVSALIDKLLAVE